MTLGNKHYQNVSDEQLIELVRQADVSAFEELYQRYNQKLLFYFYRMLGADNEKAQDFLQDLFLKIIDKKGDKGPIKHFNSWIFTIAHNMCKNEYRNSKVRNVIDTNHDLDSFADQIATPVHAPEHSVEKTIFEHALTKELRQMDANQRSTFLLKFQEGLTIKEISRVLQCSEGTTKSRLFYVTKKLADRLKVFHPHFSEV